MNHLNFIFLTLFYFRPYIIVYGLNPKLFFEEEWSHRKTWLLLLHPLLHLYNLRLNLWYVHNFIALLYFI